jgi:hypothetical protein
MSPTGFATCALLLGACDATSPVCTDELRPALHVVVQDSLSGAVVAGATVVAHDGTYRDSTMTRAQDGYAFLANGRPGLYTITVSGEQYHEWNSAAVPVAAGPCGPVPVTLHVSLQRQ